MKRTLLLAIFPAVAAIMLSGCVAPPRYVGDYNESRWDRAENRYDRRHYSGPGDHVENRLDRREDRWDRRGAW